MNIPTREEHEAELRALDRGEAQDSDIRHVLTYALLTADGALGIVTSSLYELRALISPDHTERGRDSMPVIPGITLYFSADVNDHRPSNPVANRIAAALDPDGGLGRYRGSVAFVSGGVTSIDADQREALHKYHRAALRLAEGRP